MKSPVRKESGDPVNTTTPSDHHLAARLRREAVISMSAPAERAHRELMERF